MTRYVFIHHKKKNVTQFLERSEVGFREGTIGKIRETGRLPYGVFAAYARAHDALARACRMNSTVQKKSPAYARISKLYVRAVREFLPQQSTVVEEQPDPSSTSAVVESNPPGDSPFAKCLTRLCGQVANTALSVTSKGTVSDGDLLAAADIGIAQL